MMSTFFNGPPPLTNGAASTNRSFTSVMALILYMVMMRRMLAASLLRLCGHLVNRARSSACGGTKRSHLAFQCLTRSASTRTQTSLLSAKPICQYRTKHYHFQIRLLHKFKIKLVSLKMALLSFRTPLKQTTQTLSTLPQPPHNHPHNHPPNNNHLTTQVTTLLPTQVNTSPRILYLHHHLRQ